MPVHDHYGGNAHCIECRGGCWLTGSERHLTEIVRFYFEHSATVGSDWVPPMLRSALERAGVDIAHHQRRAKEAI